MSTKAWRVVCWLLFGGALALAGCGGSTSSGPFPPLSPPVSSKPDASGLVTQIRPQVARLSDSDPLRVVLHWERDNAPLNRRTDPTPVNWIDTCNALTFHVTTPDGQKRTLKPTPRKVTGHYPAELYAIATLFIELTRKGVEVSTPNYTSDWQGGPLPALESTGVYRISVSGELMPDKPEKDKPIPFASGPVEIERGVEGYKPLDEIADLARDRVRRKLDSGHEMGGQVYDDANGDRLVHLTGPSSKQWHFTIHTVQVSPTGKVLGVFEREVSNCLAEGTKLEGEHGPVPVEEARVGVRLWGHDLQRGARVLTPVRAIRRGEANQTFRLPCGLRVTGDHPLYASGRWLPARQLTESDRLLSASGESVPAGLIERIQGRVAVYDVTVDEPNNFFAAGVLVHNKSRDRWPHLDDLWYRLWSPDGK
jgi:hypothetical protein